MRAAVARPGQHSGGPVEPAKLPDDGAALGRRDRPARAPCLLCHIRTRFIAAAFAAALIQADLDGKSIELSVRGPYPRNFHAQLRSIFELTLKRFAGIVAVRTVPCPSPACSRCYEQVRVEQLVYGLRSGPGMIEAMLNALQKDVGEIRSDMAAVRASLELLNRDFTDNYHREQSKINSHCPGVFIFKLSRPLFASVTTTRDAVRSGLPGQ